MGYLWKTGGRDPPGKPYTAAEERGADRIA